MNDYWTPDNRWAGKDVFVVGGGPSLRGFDFNRLRGNVVIGCNEAFRMGSEIMHATFFSDAKWFVRVCRALEVYGYQSLVVTHEEPLRMHNLSWLKVLKRKDFGLHRDAIGFGQNSGCGAINLALLLGAKRVYLLGFDCKSDENNNWHDHYKPYHRKGFVPPFARFIHGMDRIAKDLPVVYPGCEIINLNPDSAIPCFPKQEPDSVLPKELVLS